MELPQRASRALSAITSGWWGSEAVEAGGQGLSDLSGALPVLAEGRDGQTWPGRARQTLDIGAARAKHVVVPGLVVASVVMLVVLAREPVTSSPASVGITAALPTDVSVPRRSFDFLPALPAAVAQALAQPTAPAEVASTPTPAAAPEPSPTPVPALPRGPVRLRLRDLGGNPLIFDPSVGGLRQDPATGGTNTYQPGDVFVDPVDGRLWTWTGAQTLTSPVGSLLVDAFGA